ncbi:Brl1/Brr6 domain-containing protein [Mucor mucedo]|uniref:Brl1/Brr6 domain-containing protein n=1 Tax=Mucor mucedo TaxID=29922 RepID=UPI00221E596A|nr:Brl1/Brr6 domain-containing protein [Mucor mucedo]KAI7897299.1 Brl1/Brr6 domain-containing protein [Mucor mucedo]
MYERHQHITFTIINYLQMFFNVIVVGTILYIFVKIILVVKQDFRLKAKEHFEVLQHDRLTCSKKYMINHCGKDDQVPAIENMCNEWASCMHKDLAVAQAKVSAEAIAEIINSFVEPISYKALIFFSLLIIGSLFFSNVAFGIVKRKHNKLIQLSS